MATAATHINGPARLKEGECRQVREVTIGTEQMRNRKELDIRNITAGIR